MKSKTLKKLINLEKFYISSLSLEKQTLEKNIFLLKNTLLNINKNLDEEFSNNVYLLEYKVLNKLHREKLKTNIESLKQKLTYKEKKIISHLNKVNQYKNLLILFKEKENSKLQKEFQKNHEEICNKIKAFDKKKKG